MNDTNEVPLHIQQAEGLRALAAMIERNPDLAPVMRFPLSQMHSPLTSSAENPRELLAAFRDAGSADPFAEVLVENDVSRCMVTVKFGPVRARMSASADLMADAVPQPEYAPLAEVAEVSK